MTDHNKALEVFLNMENTMEQQDRIAKIGISILKEDDLTDEVWPELLNYLKHDVRFTDDIVHIQDDEVLKDTLRPLLREKFERARICCVREGAEFDEQKIQEAKQKVSLIKRFEDVFSKLRKPKRSDSLVALEEMTVLMIDAYEYLQLLNNEDVSKDDPEFLKEVEESVAEVNGYLKAHREDVLDRELN